MDMFTFAIPWFLSGLVTGLLLHGLIWLGGARGSGGKRWQGD